MIVFDRKTLKAEVTVGEVPGSMYGLSESGWIDGELFDLCYEHIYIYYVYTVILTCHSLIITNYGNRHTC